MSRSRKRASADNSAKAIRTRPKGCIETYFASQYWSRAPPREIKLPLRADSAPSVAAFYARYSPIFLPFGQGSLSAQVRRPRPPSVMSGSRRLETVRFAQIRDIKLCAEFDRPGATLLFRSGLSWRNLFVAVRRRIPSILAETLASGYEHAAAGWRVPKPPPICVGFGDQAYCSDPVRAEDGSFALVSPSSSTTEGYQLDRCNRC